jgi:hypothetical protein
MLGCSPVELLNEIFNFKFKLKKKNKQTNPSQFSGFLGEISHRANKGIFGEKYTKVAIF